MRRKFLRVLATLTLLCLIGSTATGSAFAIGGTAASSGMAFALNDSINPQGKRITVATYNVENFFDTQHDNGKRDWEFLPDNYPGRAEGCNSRGGSQRSRCLEKDWTQQKFQLKLQQVRRVFQYTKVDVDILALQEVENEYVVRNLAQTLGFSGYVFEEGPDRRGIDVAILYKKEKLDYKGHHSQPIRGAGTTRDILGAYFTRKGSRSSEVLAVYANHWPSQAAPSSFRMTTARALKSFIRNDQRKFGRENLHVVAMGDFNTTNSDSPHPFHDVIYTRDSGDALLDSKELVDPQYRRQMPPGTSFYPRKMKWDLFDRIFLSENLRDGSGIEAQEETYRILWHERITEDYYDTNESGIMAGSVVRGVPKRYNFGTTSANEAGFSDHLAVKVDIYLP